jgi:hypothetical protein
MRHDKPSCSSLLDAITCRFATFQYIAAAKRARERSSSETVTSDLRQFFIMVLLSKGNSHSDLWESHHLLSPLSLLRQPGHLTFSFHWDFHLKTIVAKYVTHAATDS